jgi:hypothetical protein
VPRLAGRRAPALICLVALYSAIALSLGSAGADRSIAAEAAASSGRTYLPLAARSAGLPERASTPTAVATGSPSPGSTPGATATPGVGQSVKRRVNAPRFAGPVDPAQAAIFWLGRVDATANYADVRVGYGPSELYVNVEVIDRRLWYQAGLSVPSAELTGYDSVSLLLDTAGDAGGGPGATSHRFDAGLSWWEPARSAYQAAYAGTGAGWVPAATGFTTEAGWRGDAPNNDGDDKGWVLTYHLPFASLGLAGPPAEGTVWGLGLQLHDRDAAESAIADQVWPEGLAAASPGTWGPLRFGLPAYAAPTAATGSTTVRQGLNGASVPDGQVGGYTTCGDRAAADNYFPGWGGLNYRGYTDFNVQNEADVSDWPCFSKYYVSFPLGGVPAGKTIVSAQLILHQFGNSAGGAASLVQVFTVDQPWDPATLSWNTAPPARENVARSWVDALPSFPGWPGVARQWDLSYAVARARAADQPYLNLAVYSADTGYNSGKYFVSSATEAWNAEARPTLTITWGP